MLFSDKYRSFKIIGLLFLLSSLSVYHYIVISSIGCGLPRLKKYLQNPAKFDGQEIIFTFDKVEAVTKNGLQILADDSKSLFIKGRVNGIKEKDVISVKLTFQKDTTLKITQLHIHKGEIWRKIVSIPVFLGILIMFFIKYKFDPKRFIFKERFKRCQTY